MIARAFPTTIFPWIQIGFKEKWCGDMPLVYFQCGDTLLVCIETCQRHVATLWCNVASVEKYRSPRRKINPVGTWYFTSAHNCITILIINHLARTRSIASLPSKIVLRNLMHFLPILHVIIKAVFYVFVFDSIHGSATMHNLSPLIFYWTAMLHPFSSK